MQALVTYHPEYAVSGNGDALRICINRQLRKFILVVSLPLLLVGFFVPVPGTDRIPILALVASMIVLEIRRIQDVALLSAIRRQRLIGLWSLSDAWMRPTLAATCAWGLGATVTHTLLGQFLGMLLVYLPFQFAIPRLDALIDEHQVHLIAHRVRQYATPLLPLGVFGWLSGMSDRYMIAAILSPTDVGLYSAVYGLASRPMLVISNVIELIMRPSYQIAIARQHRIQARLLLWKWASAVALVSFAAILSTLVLHRYLASVLLGSEFRTASQLMILVVVGYSLLMFSHISTRVVYAHEATRKILAIESIGAASAVTIGFYLIETRGIYGAALAVPIYYMIQLAASVLFARKWLWS